MSRGRGDATLEHTGDTQGDTAGLEAKKLPPGAVVPKTWERVGVTRTAPTGEAERDTGSGSQGTTGGGEASWRRRLAPHHREAVRRYFGGDDEGGDAR